jgi:hypothetical protein
MVAQVRYSVAGWSRGQVGTCAVCTVHVEIRSAGLLVEPRNQGLFAMVNRIKYTPVEPTLSTTLKMCIKCRDPSSVPPWSLELL